MALPSSLKDRHDPKHYAALRQNALDAAKTSVRESVTPDVWLIQLLHALDELHKAASVILPRVREAFGYYYPELIREQRDGLALCKTLLTSIKRPAGTLGAKAIDPAALESLRSLAKAAAHLLETAQEAENELAALMRKNCPSISAMCGETLAARLLAQAGSLKRLASIPASTIQVLGAEKALFRHLTQRAKGPKYGVLFAHPIVQRVPQSDKGKAARAVADKTAICAKVDYFGGTPIGTALRKSVEARFA